MTVPGGFEPRTVSDALADLDRHTIGPRSYRTGFTPLDDALGGGLRSGTLNLIAGVPGVGKTIMAMQWTRYMARAGHHVAYVCYEHDEPTMLGRLLLSEMGDLSDADGLIPRSDVREALWNVANGTETIGVAAAGSLHARAAHASLNSYGERILLQRASTARIGIKEIEALIPPRDEEGVVVFVDYLQKVGGDITDNVVALKDIATDHDIAVVAIVAGNESGLQQRRFRPHHLLDAEAVTYEADSIVVMNHKYHAVSKRHTAYDPVRAETFKRELVITVEKNRAGPSGVNISFEKDFVNFRIRHVGEYLDEALVDDVVFPD